MKILHEQIQQNYTITKRQRKNGGHDHWHQRAEFVYILEGQSTIRVGKEEYLCKAGDLSVIHSGEIHSIFSTADCTMYICTFDPSILYSFQSETRFIKNYISADELNAVGVDQEIRRIFDEILQEKEKEMSCYEMVIQSNIIRLYSLLIRYFERDTLPDNKSLIKFQNFQNALQYIEKNYSRNITLVDIAATINYNPSYVSKLFVVYTGVNFKNYLDNFRINQAVKMLKKTDLTILDISARCGYDNIRTFNHVFKRITGNTPTELRKNNI